MQKKDSSPSLLLLDAYSNRQSTNTLQTCGESSSKSSLLGVPILPERIASMSILRHMLHLPGPELQRAYHSSLLPVLPSSNTTSRITSVYSTARLALLGLVRSEHYSSPGLPSAVRRCYALLSTGIHLPITTTCPWMAMNSPEPCGQISPSTTRKSRRVKL
jgi:hypothetical protein